jgi:hypothetical protein
MFVIGLLFTLAATGMSMYAQKQAGDASMAAGRHQNQLERARAANLENEFIERATRQRINDRADRSRLIARQGASGLTAHGAPELILGKAAAAQELAIADAARNANQQASDARARGQMALFEGQQTKSASRLSMLGTGLQAGASLYTTGTQAKHQGLIK